MIGLIPRYLDLHDYVNIMDQYYPAGGAFDVPGLDRRISRDEFRVAIEAAEAAGLTRLDQKAG